MVTETAVTKAEVLKLAQKKYGPKAHIQHNPKAIDEAARAVIVEQRKQVAARKKQLEEEKKALFAQGDPRKALREAARFAVDVDGDEPSWTQLRESLEREELYAAMSEEIREIETELRKGGSYWSRRWGVFVIVNMAGLLMNKVHESADTLEELAAKLGK